MKGRVPIEEVHRLLPAALAEKLRNRQEFIADSSPGPVRGFLQGNEFRVLAKKLSDGSIIQRTPAGRGAIEKYLKKSGAEEPEIKNVLGRFDATPENIPIPINKDMHAVKWSAGPLQPTLDGAFLSDRFIVKVAYEFLACILGKSITTDHPPLSTARAILKGAQPSGGNVRVEHLHANKYAALHGIFFEGNRPHVVIQVRLFGWLAFRVHFEKLAIRAPSLTYTHLLDEGVDGWRLVDSRSTDEFPNRIRRSPQ